MTDKVSIVLFSGTVDKLLAASIVSGGAVAMGLDVDIFITFWGLNAFRKDMLQTNVKFSKDFEEMGPMLAQMMQKKNIPPWYETLKSAREAGNVKIHACSMTYDVMGMKKEDLSPLVDDIIGAGKFVDMAKDAKFSLFI